MPEASPASWEDSCLRQGETGEKNLKEKATYSVIFFASSVEAAVELAEKTR